MRDIYGIHDKTFKNALTHIAAARDFFHHYLPASVQTHINFDTLKLNPNTFVDQNLDELRSDVLYQVQIANHSGYIYILCEHQSTIDNLMPFRLWGYMLRIWEEHLKQTKSSTLPLIFPMVFYNGRVLYHGPRSLHALLQGPRELIQTVLFEDFHLIDTHDLADEALQKQRWAGVLAFMFKHVYDRDVGPLLPFVIEMLKELQNEYNGIEYSETLLIYWLKRADIKKGPKAFIEKIQQELSLPKEGAIMTIAEQLMQQGMQQGECAILLRLLKHKFKTIPVSYERMIKQANSERLLELSERILENDTLEEVFATYTCSST